MIGAATIQTEVRHAHLFCGIGGGAVGFNRGSARVGNTEARFVCVGGIDSDPAACRDFERKARAPATCRDLFSLDQYRDFHGRDPAPGWEEAGPDALHRAFRLRPHIVFLSAPCKGFSGLLSETSSKTARYQALNGLTLRGVWLLLEAYKDDPVELLVFENVPRIATRGRWLLDQIVALLRAYGYAVAETTHDCGELGELGQSRKRFLLVARHQEKVPPFLYEPPKHRLLGVGDVLERLPMPLTGEGGAMHRMPALQWKTWVRLAFVRAGADWRSLNDLAVEGGFLKDFGIVPAGPWRSDVLGVMNWTDTAGTVTSRSGPTNGRFAVADPRAGELASKDRQAYGVGAWEDPAATVTSARSPGQGRFSVADPRFAQERRKAAFGVRGWEEPAGVVQGESLPSNGSFAVADPRPPEPIRGGKYRVTRMDEPAGTVIASSTTGNGAFAVSDPRVDGHPRSVQLGVREWSEPSGVVTGQMAAGQGPNSVADPRLGGKRFNTTYRIVRWDETAPAVAGPGGPGGGLAVADPRATHGPNAHHNKMRVEPWTDPCHAVTGTDRVGSGALCVADPRWRDGRDAYLSAGHYGVVPWTRPSRAVFGHGQHDNGFNSVADPRPDGKNSSTDESCGINGLGAEWTSPREEPEKSSILLPAPDERLVCVIFARDGTWHRPFTTLELAALQGLVDPEEQFELDGLSDAAWRERIGNCVPPPSATAIASVMGETLLLAWAGETFKLSAAPIWVRDVAVGLSVRPQEIDQ